MFTRREMDIIKLILKGKTNSQIAKTLYISKHTVKAHVEHIFAKINVHSRIELILYMLFNN